MWQNCRIILSPLCIPGSNSTVELLPYYTIDQMIADYGHLIQKVKQDFQSPQSKVIMFGYLGGGLFSVLAAKRFPHLVDGVYASGGLFTFPVPNERK